MVEASANTAAEFRPPRWILVVMLLVVALGIGMAVLSFATPAPAWQRVFAGMFVLLALLGVVEASLCRLRLDDEGICLVSNFRSRRIARSDIDGVTWASGAGVTLKLVGGDGVRLPEVGRNSQALANSLRAWLRRTGRASR